MAATEPLGFGFLTFSSQIFVGPGYRARNVVIRGEDASESFVEGVVWRNEIPILGITFSNLYFYGTTEPYVFNWDFNSTTPYSTEDSNAVFDLKVDSCIFRAEPSPYVYEPIWPSGIFREKGGYGGNLTFTKNICGGATFLYYGERPATRIGHDSNFSLIIDSNTLWHYSCKIYMQSQANSHERVEYTNNVIIRPEGTIYAWVDSFTEHTFYGARHAVFSNNDFGYDISPEEYKIRIAVQSWETLEVNNNVFSSVVAFIIADGDPICPNTVATGNYMLPPSYSLADKFWPRIIFRCRETRSIDASKNYWGFVYGPKLSYLLSTTTATQPDELPTAVSGFPWYIDSGMTRLAIGCADSSGRSACDRNTEKCDYSVGSCVCSTCPCTVFFPFVVLSSIAHSALQDSYQPSTTTPPTGTITIQTPSGEFQTVPAGSADGVNGDNNNGNGNQGGGGSQNVGATVGAAIGGIATPFVILALTIFVAKKVFGGASAPTYSQYNAPAGSSYVPPPQR